VLPVTLDEGSTVCEGKAGKRRQRG
jgi:hypothetical protein